MKIPAIWPFDKQDLLWAETRWFLYCERWLLRDAYLEEASILGREVLAVRHPGHLVRSGSLRNAADDLFAQYQTRGP